MICERRNAPRNCKSSSRAAATSAMHALDNLALLQLRFGHTTDAVGAEVRVTRLNAPQAAEILISRFLPLCNQISVSNFLLQTILVELARDDLPAEVHVVDVARLLMVNLEDGPERLVDALAFVGFGLG